MSNSQQSDKPTLRNIVVSIVITPEGDGLRTDASVSVNGKPADNIQVGLILAGDIALGTSSGAETTRQMRALAGGAVSLAEALREQAMVGLEEALAKALQPEEDAPQDNSENSLAKAA